MTRSFLIRHHRLVFFLGFYLAYVAVLFGIAGAHDPSHARRSLVRLLFPAVELGLAALLCAGCLRMARRGPRLPGMLLSRRRRTVRPTSSWSSPKACPRAWSARTAGAIRA